MNIYSKSPSDLTTRPERPVAGRKQKSSTQPRGNNKVAKKRPQKGDLVEITFLDHAEDGDVIRFRVHGELYDISRTAYKVRSWAYASDVDRAAGNPDNEKTFSIVKKAVESVRVLK